MGNAAVIKVFLVPAVDALMGKRKLDYDDTLSDMSSGSPIRKHNRTVHRSNGPMARIRVIKVEIIL